MSPRSWRQRRLRLISLLFPTSASRNDGPNETSQISDDELARKLNDVLEEEHVAEIDALTFGNQDLVKLGRLAKGTYGAVDMVRCKLDNRIYARKVLSKTFAHRAREQCFPLVERVIHSVATATSTPWAPHLIAAYQTPLDLYFVTQYVDGGTLADLLEFAQGGIAETEVPWWLPQAIAAIGWLHEQGFVHRDIKPANFLITPTSHLQLTDFGSAARLLPPSPEGVQLVPKNVCQQLCGTVDYISPEMLAFDEAKHEADEVQEDFLSEGYGQETDWWSLGVMAYEMVYGVVPFFADSVEETLKRIMNHARTLQFPSQVKISTSLKSLIKSLLTDAPSRLGRRGLHEIQSHPYLKNIPWQNLHKLPRPENLLLPEFSDASNINILSPELQESSEPESYFPEGSFTTIHPEYTLRPRSDHSHTKLVSPFHGFTWGPPKDAFDHALPSSALPSVAPTPRVLRRPAALQASTAGHKTIEASYMTPLRPGFTPGASTTRRTRPMSEHQALRQLMSAVRESAHKKVLESGKKPWSHLAKKERAIVPMGQLVGTTGSAGSGGSTGPAVVVLASDDEQDYTARTDVPPPSPSPSPRPGSSLARVRPPSRATSVPAGEWSTTSVAHEKEPPDRMEDLERRRRKLKEGIEDAEKRLRELKLLVQA